MSVTICMLLGLMWLGYVFLWISKLAREHPNEPAGCITPLMCISGLLAPFIGFFVGIWIYEVTRW